MADRRCPRSVSRRSLPRRAWRHAGRPNASSRPGECRSTGGPCAELGSQADPEHDRIEVDGRPIRRPEAKRYLLLHKPPGYLTTRDDPHGRPRVFDLLPDLGVRLHSVGRLDFDAEGLLLLTNDGELTQRLTHPRHGVPRVYRVLVTGRPGLAALAALERGVTLEDGPARAERARRLPTRRRAAPGSS